MATSGDTNSYTSQRETDDGEREVKRIKTDEDATSNESIQQPEDATNGGVISTAATGNEEGPYPGYDLDPSGSGWYINRQTPSWQYSPASNLHYNAQANIFYRVDPKTKEYVVVDYNEAMSQNTGANEVEEEVKGLGKGPLLPHVADYTFMQVIFVLPPAPSSYHLAYCNMCPSVYNSPFVACTRNIKSVTACQMVIKFCILLRLGYGRSYTSVPLSGGLGLHVCMCTCTWMGWWHVRTRMFRVDGLHKKIATQWFLILDGIWKVFRMHLPYFHVLPRCMLTSAWWTLLQGQ